MLVGVQDGPFPTEKGGQMSRQTTYAFTLGLSHPTFRNLLEKEHHLHKIIHCWVALLKVNHDSAQAQLPDSSTNAEASSKIIYKMIWHKHIPLNDLYHFQ